jgi:hypothetical protein
MSFVTAQLVVFLSFALGYLMCELAIAIAIFKILLVTQ